MGKVDNEEPNIFLQIINDLQIEIKEVVIQYEDTISYKEVPFTLGIVLNKMIMRSSNKDFIVDNNIKESIEHQEINYKVFNIDKFSIFMDCYDNLKDFDRQNLYSISVRQMSSKNILMIDKEMDYYFSYCLKELNVYSKNKNSHQFILYKMELNINISINENYLKNNLPKYFVSINLPKLNIRFHLKQTKTIFKVMAYNNLNQLYQNGIAKEYYIKKLNGIEKKNYINKYINYYVEKYYNKNEHLKYPPELSEIENALSFENIQEMREIAYKELDEINEYLKIKNNLKIEEEKWYGKDLNKIEKLKEELEKYDNKKKKSKEIKNKKKNENFK